MDDHILPNEMIFCHGKLNGPNQCDKVGRGASTYRAQAGMSNRVTSTHTYICGVSFRYRLSTTCDSVRAEHYWDINIAEAVTNANEEYHHGYLVYSLVMLILQVPRLEAEV